MPDSTVRPAFNPWPYALIAFFAVFISCVVGFGIFAVRQKVDLVGADYYEQEVRFQKQIDRAARTKALGQPVAITYEHATNQITVTLPAGPAAQNPLGQIRLYRPSDAALDREIALATDAQGRQCIDASVLKEGRWKVRVNWTAAGAEYFAEQTLLVAGPVAR
jgi:nitrogen fixation protein FixH